MAATIRYPGGTCDPPITTASVRQHILGKVLDVRQRGPRCASAGDLGRQADLGRVAVVAQPAPGGLPEPTLWGPGADGHVGDEYRADPLGMPGVLARHRAGER